MDGTALDCLPTCLVYCLIAYMSEFKEYVIGISKRGEERRMEKVGTRGRTIIKLNTTATKKFASRGPYELLSPRDGGRVRIEVVCHTQYSPRAMNYAL